MSAPALDSSSMAMHGHSEAVLLRTVVIGLAAFLTVVDLFATQAILPSLTRAYGVTPAAMGFAVNASTMGMAVAGLVVALFSRRIDRRLGILISLAVLAIPTALLAVAPDLTTFTSLRVAQGLCMASAFTLTLAYLGEECSAADAGGAFAAYITGNVASNLIGRLISAAVADHLGLACEFLLLCRAQPCRRRARLLHGRTRRSDGAHRSNCAVAFCRLARASAQSPLRAAFGIGFCILFAFIGTFTYVNFVLVRPPLSLGPMELGLVYVVFLPSVVTTPLAGRVVASLRNATDLVGVAVPGGRRLAASAVAQPCGSPARHGSRRRRDVLRPGDGDRLRQPRRAGERSERPARQLYGARAGHSP